MHFRRGGFIDDALMYIIGLMLVFMTFTVGEDLVAMQVAQYHVSHVADLVARDEAINGCVSTQGEQLVLEYLQNTNMYQTAVTDGMMLIQPSNAGGAVNTNSALYGNPVEGKVTYAYQNQILGLQLPWYTYLSALVPAFSQKTGVTASSCDSTAISSSQLGVTQINPKNPSDSVAVNVLGTQTSLSNPQGNPNLNPPGSNGPVSMSMSVTPSTVPEGGLVTVSGQAFDSSGAGVPAASVAVTIGGTTYTATTDSNGYYSVQATAPYAPGSYTVSATAGGAAASGVLTVTSGGPAQILLSYSSSDTPGTVDTIYGTVLDANGNPVADSQVFVTLPGGGTTTVTTDSSGDFVYNFTPTTTGQQQVVFSDGGASATATIDVIYGNPANVTEQITGSPASNTGTPTDGMTTVAGTVLTVSGKVTDVNGYPVGGATVVVSVLGDDNVQPITLTTDSNGNYSTPLTIDQAYGWQVQAYVNQNVSAVVNVEVNPNQATQVYGLAASPTKTDIGSNVSISGTVEDQFGNPEGVNNTGQPQPEQPYAGYVTLSSPALKGSPVTTYTGPGGQLSATVQFTEAGTWTVAVDNSLGNQIGSVQVTVVNAAAYTLTLTPAQTTIEAGTADTVTVTLTDANGNPVAGQTVDISESPQGSGVLSTTSVTTGADGTATFTVTPTQEGTATVTGVADIGGATVQNSASITVNPGAPSQIT